MSFVPPDGHFTLAEYRYSGGSSLGGSTIAATKDQVPIPFGVKASIEFEGNTGRFCLDAHVLSLPHGLIFLARQSYL